MILPFYHARLGNPTIDGANVRAEMQYGDGIAPRDFSLVLRAQYYPAAGGDWGRQERPVISRPLETNVFEHTYGGNVRSAEAELFWDRTKSPILRSVDSKHAKRVERSYNTQLKLYEIFDPGFPILDEVLRGGKDGRQQIDFEWGIAHLLVLAGFQVHWLGYTRGRMKGDEIDIVAWLPHEKRLLLCECFLKGGALEEKITNLSERAKAVEETVAGWHVKKAIFTRLSDQAFKGGPEESARIKSVVLVDSGALERLAVHVKAGHPPEGTWEGFQPHITNRADLFKF